LEEQRINFRVQDLEWQSIFLSPHKWLLLELLDDLPSNPRTFYDAEMFTGSL
jgi:hypothetical protein